MCGFLGGKVAPEARQGGSMLEIDSDKVRVGVADVPFYDNDQRPVRVPPYLAVRELSPRRCSDCPPEAEKRSGLISWLALRNDKRTPTQWVTLCDEHFEKTARKKPLIFP